MERSFKAHRPKQAEAAAAAPKARRKAEEKSAPEASDKAAKAAAAKRPKEIGGPSGPEPTRYGDWERKGICVDF